MYDSTNSSTVIFDSLFISNNNNILSIVSMLKLFDFYINFLCYIYFIYFYSFIIEKFNKVFFC